MPVRERTLGGVPAGSRGISSLVEHAVRRQQRSVRYRYSSQHGVCILMLECCGIIKRRYETQYSLHSLWQK